MNGFDPRQPHGVSLAFQHEPGAPCVVCDNDSSLRATVDRINAAPDPAPAMLAEARDASGLRLDADLTERLSDHFGHAHSTYACNCGDRFRAALATAPPEPRWPSRDELAKALHATLHPAVKDCTLGRGTLVAQPDGTMGPPSWAGKRQCEEQADAILAALREGGERP